MKDFIKWLGVNEKVAKVVVWTLIIMVTLIIVNTALESIGFPNYKITYDNLVNINTNKAFNILFSCIICILNFYGTILLVFRIKESKKIFKYAFLYMLLVWLTAELFNYAISQVFIFVYIISFCYFYSNKKKKTVIYGIIAIVINTFLQGVAYLYKVQLINFQHISDVTRALLSIDYFIIIAIIILVKEIYLRKRGEGQCCMMDHQVGYGGENSKKKTNLQKK